MFQWPKCLSWKWPKCFSENKNSLGCSWLVTVIGRRCVVHRSNSVSNAAGHESECRGRTQWDRAKARRRVAQRAAANDGCHRYAARQRRRESWHEYAWTGWRSEKWKAGEFTARRDEYCSAWSTMPVKRANQNLSAFIPYMWLYVRIDERF